MTAVISTGLEVDRTLNDMANIHRTIRTNDTMEIRKWPNNITIIYITIYKALNTVCSYVSWTVLDVPDAHSPVTQLFLTCCLTYLFFFGTFLDTTGQKSCSLSGLHVQLWKKKKSEIKPQNCRWIQTPGASNTQL